MSGSKKAHKQIHTKEFQIMYDLKLHTLIDSLYQDKAHKEIHTKELQILPALFYARFAARRRFRKMFLCVLGEVVWGG